MEHPMLAVRLFGAPDLRGRAGTDWEIHLPHRALSVLARLLLVRGNIGRDDIAFLLWPDEPEDEARANLRRAIYGITQTLPPRAEPWIRATRTTLAWAGGPDASVDVIEYEELLEQGRYAQADSLYMGDLLESLDEPWIEPERERLREAQLDCLMQLLNDARARGDSVTAMRYAKRALRIDPWREDFERVLIALRRDAGDRAGALQEYKRFASALHGEIGVDPMPETTAEAMQTPAPAPLKRTRSTIPSPISSFVGRETELRELTSLLGTNRLVSVLGPGGVGKTRLAVAVAHRMENDFAAADFIDVAPVKQTEFFLPAVASALGLRDFTAESVYSRIADTLSGEPRLLLIDNCERVTEASATFAARILQACPQLRILTTSREPLHVTGEIWYEVQPLPLDDALTLLCDRVRALYPAFALTGETAAAIVSICKRLDGIPLAIELAASRARTLSPNQILERLDDRFELLCATSTAGVPHQQTLRAAIDWSYEMLSSSEAQALRALALFHGGADLAAVQAMWEPEIPREQTLGVLTTLVEKSFVRVMPGRRSNRYTLLESIREYLLEKLRDSGEFRYVRTRHALYYAEFAEAIEPLLVRGDQSSAIDRLSVEDENFRAVLDADAEDRTTREVQLRLSVALRWYYNFRGMLTEAIAYLNKGLALLEAMPDNPQHDLLALRLHASLGTTMMLAKSWAAPEAEAAYETASTLIHAATDHREAIWILWGIWVYHQVRGNMHGALAARDRLRAVARRHGDEVSTLIADMVSLQVAFYTGNFHECLAFCRTVEATFRPEHRALISLYTIDIELVTLVHRSLARWILGDAQASLAAGGEAESRARRLAHPYSLAWTLTWGSTPYLLSGDLDALGKCLREGLHISESHHFSFIAAMAKIMLGWIAGRSGSLDAGIAQMERGLDALHATGAAIAVPHFRTLIAEFLGAASRTGEALAMLSAAERQVSSWNERWQLAEVYRVRGDLTGDLGCYQAARDVAAAQDARAWLARAKNGEAACVSK